MKILKDKRKFIPQILFLFICLLAILSIYSYLYIFRIKTIVVNGNLKNLYGLETIINNSLISFDKEKATQILLKNNFLVQNIYFTKSYPDKLLISFSTKEIYAQIEGKQGIYFISFDGYILQKTSNINSDQIPLIQDKTHDYFVGNIVDRPILSIIELIANIKKVVINPIRIMIDRPTSTATIELDSGTQIIISLTKDNTSIPASLQIIVSRFRIESRTLRTIDFRFDKPIVTLANGDKLSP